jgi:hypothetical protein
MKEPLQQLDKRPALLVSLDKSVKTQSQLLKHVALDFTRLQQIQLSVTFALPDRNVLVELHQHLKLVQQVPIQILAAHLHVLHVVQENTAHQPQ